MFFGRDEAELRKLREKAYREELVANIKEKQQQKTSPNDPPAKQEQPSYFMQQSQRQHQEREQKRQKYLQELREQQEAEIKLKEERKKQQQERDRLLDEKVRREAEELNRKQLEEIEREKNGKRKGVPPQPNEEFQPMKRQPSGRRPPLNPPAAREEQQPSIANTPPKNDLLIKKIESFEMPEDRSELRRINPSPSPNYLNLDERPKYNPVYADDLRRIKNNLEEQAYRMGQLKQKIQSASRSTFEVGKYNTSLTELQNLNKQLQEKHQHYYRLPLFDSLDREVHSREAQRASDPHEQEFSAFYEFKL